MVPRSCLIGRDNLILLAHFKNDVLRGNMHPEHFRTMKTKELQTFFPRDSVNPRKKEKASRCAVGCGFRVLYTSLKTSVSYNLRTHSCRQEPSAILSCPVCRQHYYSGSRCSQLSKTDYFHSKGSGLPNDVDSHNAGHNSRASFYFYLLFPSDDLLTAWGISICF